eukprot:245762-Prorocentrum_minimum.AAC.1
MGPRNKPKAVSFGKAPSKDPKEKGLKIHVFSRTSPPPMSMAEDMAATTTGRACLDEVATPKCSDSATDTEPVSS